MSIIKTTTHGQVTPSSHHPPACTPSLPHLRRGGARRTPDCWCQTGPKTAGGLVLGQKLAVAAADYDPSHLRSRSKHPEER